MYEKKQFWKPPKEDSAQMEEVILLKTKISASVLSADLMNFGDEIRRLEENDIDMLHFDVMDGVFVNNITYGLPVLEAVRKQTDLTLDVHLMITDPLKYAERFAKFGADIISFHLESESNAMETISAIKKAGAKAALAIKPATPAEAVFDYLPYLDMVLVMTVEPGFGGQSFMADMIPKVAEIRELAEKLNPKLHIEVDGGIDGETVKQIVPAGANMLVAGTAVFRAEDGAQAAIERLHNAQKLLPVH